MVIGFFMILVDSTIVSVATPAIRDALDTDYNTVIWVTSAYLLAYAVPLLITGRLGDRLGPKRVYLTGLSIFTLASLWCALTTTVELLIVARVFQGLGASLMTPQTMSVITRTFPPHSRGRAMALWGATAGVATLVGPVLGGVLVDAAGWEWIFFVNVPVGVIGFVLAWKLVPQLETHTHSFDWLGVGLSAAAMFLIVFGIQEGERYDWGTITGVVSVPLLIGAGLVVGAVFLWWQSRIRREPLVPLALFRDRNFSVSNAAISTVSFSVTAMSFPFMLWAQSVRGWTPTESGMLLIPMAVVTGVMAPIVGRFTDRVAPRLLTSVGFGASAVGLVLMSRFLTPDSPVWGLLLVMALIGFGNAFLWSPLAATATRNLPMSSAGAGSGVYNATRQVGAVLGSAAIAAAIESRLATHLPQASGAGAEGAGAAALPPEAFAPFATAMSEAVLVPAAAFLVGLVLVQLFTRPTRP
ncbi:DHA2 family efflux MFS transporter permease subunit [Aeromicrobium camelliae]|uniref:DHA2 family efflux MFS transporter permease subunit n=3 Tax=Aeromicrobium TaxID=2040 RepID=A0A3N6ZMX2_9ACTN|nr:DHA2 family efflux MFS transporter permease subunit [Aeromicrobium camelliae]RQN08397.1 DHA2 family efflux MFS transporter permease subunit [Aeromicrobium camelliae]